MLQYVWYTLCSLINWTNYNTIYLLVGKFAILWRSCTFSWVMKFVFNFFCWYLQNVPDNKIHGANVGQTKLIGPHVSTLNIVINFSSYCIVGGSVTAGLGIYDTMQYVRPPIATWCVGQACSMASLLLAAGSPGMRHSLPNSRIMIHQPSGQAVVRIWILL